jgi:hypothetical protein
MDSWKPTTFAWIGVVNKHFLGYGYAIYEKLGEDSKDRVEEKTE